MPFITEVHFKNYRSFLDAKCRLSPVTLVIGANNAGKSNFLRGVEIVLKLAHSDPGPFFADYMDEFCESHHRREKTADQEQSIYARSGAEESFIVHTCDETTMPNGWVTHSCDSLHIKDVSRYQLQSGSIGTAESDTEQPKVHSDGEGVTRVLQWLSLKKKRVFHKLEEEFRNFVPEVEELTFERADQGKWFLQVLEKGFDEPVSLSEMSEGTRTILALLTIIYQPNRPEVILLEDIEHAIHPRGIAEIIETMRRISQEHGVQFIMTSHHPYVLDCFRAKEFWGDVVIVEKKDGVSRLANMDVRLKRLHYEEEMDKVRLHELWYSGLMGGVANPPPAWDKES